MRTISLQEDNFEEEILSTEQIFTGSVLNLRVDQIEQSTGHRASREVVEHSGGVTIIPLLSEKQIVMVKQYRHAAAEVLLELPAGKLEKGEQPRACVQRELIEETGYNPGKVEKLFSFYTTPAYSSELLHLYLGRDLEFDKKDPDQGEIIVTEIIHRHQIMDLIEKGKIKDSKTIIGLLYILGKGL